MKLNKEEKELLWECPNCHYLINDTQRVQAAFDYECPNCRRTTISRFHIRNEYEVME